MFRQGAAAAAKLRDLRMTTAAPPSAAGSHLVDHSGNDASLLEAFLPPCHGVSLASSCLAISAIVHSMRCSSKLITRWYSASPYCSLMAEQH